MEKKAKRNPIISFGTPRRKEKPKFYSKSYKKRKKALFRRKNAQRPFSALRAEIVKKETTDMCFSPDPKT